MIECTLDEWLDAWFFAPFWELEKNVKDASCTMGSTVVVCAMEVVSKNTLCVYVCRGVVCV